MPEQKECPHCFEKMSTDVGKCEHCGVSIDEYLAEDAEKKKGLASEATAEDASTEDRDLLPVQKPESAKHPPAPPPPQQMEAVPPPPVNDILVEPKAGPPVPPVNPVQQAFPEMPSVKDKSGVKPPPPPPTTKKVAPATQPPPIIDEVTSVDAAKGKAAPSSVPTQDQPLKPGSEQKLPPLPVMPATKSDSEDSASVEAGPVSEAPLPPKETVPPPPPAKPVPPAPLGQTTSIGAGSVPPPLPPDPAEFPPSPPEIPGRTMPGMKAADKKKDNTGMIIGVAAAFVFLALGGTALYFLFLQDRQESADDVASHVVINDTHDQDQNDTGSSIIIEDPEDPEPSPPPDPTPPPPSPPDPAPTPPAEEPPADETVVAPAPAQQTINWNQGQYTGALKDGVPHGQGAWTHFNGTTYTGEFNNGSITGYGTMFFTDGSVVVGYFVNGIYQDSGATFPPDDRSTSGTIDDNEDQGEWYQIEIQKR
jgi:hypothetical protein